MSSNRTNIKIYLKILSLTLYQDEVLTKTKILDNL
jgi:hypothetical protein